MIDTLMLSEQQKPERHNLQNYYDSKPLIISPETELSAAITLMSQNRHSCILIASQDRIEGIFTERDLVKLIASAIDFAQVTIAEVMTQQPYTIFPTDNLHPAAIFTLFKQHQIRHLPVVDAAEKAVGIITPTSLRQGINGGYLLKHRQVKEVMEQQVIQAPGDRSIAEMAQLMAVHRVSCVVITEQDHEEQVLPIGIVTERDLLQFKVLNLDLQHLPVREVMSSPLLPIHPEDNLQKAHELMSQHHISRLVVTDCQGYLAGIVTQTNILQNLDSKEIHIVVEFLEDLLQEKNQQLAAKQEIEQRQQEQLDLNQHYLDSILEGTAHIVLLVTPDQHSVNTITQKSRNINPQQYHLIQETINQFRQPETSQRFYAPVQQALDNNQKLDFVYSITLPTGRQLRFTAQISPLPDKTAIWVARDITQTRGAEWEQAEEETRLEQLFESKTQKLQSTNQLLQKRINYLLSCLSILDGEDYLENSWLRLIIPYKNNLLENWFNRLQKSHFPPYTGAIVALVIASIIELCRRGGVIIPVPFMLLIITVAVSANFGGVVSGLWAHLVWSIFVIYAAITGFGPATLTGGPIQVTAGILVMGIFAVIQGWTKEQNRRLNGALRHLNANLEQEIRQRTRKLVIAYGKLQQEAMEHLVSKEALARSEAKFRAIFEHAGVGITVAGLDKKLLQVNPKFCQFIGYTAAELQSMTFEQITHPEDREGDQQHVRQMRSQKIPTLIKEKRYIHKDGSTIWGNLTAVVVTDATQKPSYFIAVVEDITKRKRAELALLESETYFINLLNDCPFLVWTSGTDGLCSFFNTAWLDYTGRALTQELGNGWAEGVHPEDLEFCLDIYQTAFTRRERFQMEYRLRKRNGQYGWIYDEGIPRFKADGSFAGYIGTCVDISDRIKVKQEREQLLEKVEQERQFLKSVLQQMPAGVVIVEAPSGKIILSNQQTAEIMKYQKLPALNKIDDYALVKSWNSQGTPRPTNKLFIIKALKGHLTSGEEVEVLCGDGSKRIIFANAAPIRNSQSKIIAAIATFYDVTQQKQAEAVKKDA
ncbi:MAG: PAS domain S-box protein, partial [Cyanobacteria bacterium P01_A01_bin.40]